MRLNNFLVENTVDVGVDKAHQEFSNMSKSSAEYALKIHYKEFIECVKKNGSEKNIIDFVNHVFDCNISKLEDLDFATVKLREGITIPTINLNIVRKFTDIIGVSPDKIKASCAAFLVLLSKYGLR